jgi:hypothetical protein
MTVVVSVAALMVAITSTVVSAFYSAACQKNLTAPVSIEHVDEKLEIHKEAYNGHVLEFKEHEREVGRKMEEQGKLIVKVDKQTALIAQAVGAERVPEEVNP